MYLSKCGHAYHPQPQKQHISKKSPIPHNGLPWSHPKKSSRTHCGPPCCTPPKPSHDHFLPQSIIFLHWICHVMLYMYFFERSWWNICDLLNQNLVVFWTNYLYVLGLWGCARDQWERVCTCVFVCVNYYINFLATSVGQWKTICVMDYSINPAFS